MLALAGMVALLSSPLASAQGWLSTRWLSVHLLLELCAIVVAVMVVAVTFHTFDNDVSPIASALGAGFLIVAVCDLMHALVSEGMPVFISEASTPRAIFFWLMGRSFEVGILGLIAFQMVPRWRRRTTLLVGASVAAVVVAFGSWRLEAFPTTFVPGEGVTAFKARYELVLCALNLLMAGVLGWQGWERDNTQYRLLAMSSFMMGVGELAFTSYMRPSDFQNVAGHLYKLVAYALLYRAVFIERILAPHEALKAAARHLQESEARLRTLSDNLPQAIIYQVCRDMQHGRRYLYMGGGLERVLGLKAEDALHDPDLLLSRILPEDRACFDAARLQAHEALQVFHSQVRMRHADGSVRHVAFTSAPRQRSDDGAVIWDGLALDVTHTVEAEQARQGLEAQLRDAQKMESLGTLASGIAHDFNHLIGAILGNTALAREDAQLGRFAAVEQSLDQIDRAGARARELVGQILTFGRRQPTQRQRLALGPTVTDSLELLRATLPPQVSLQMQGGAEPIEVMGDATQIGQVVLNLITNAWQALEGQAGRIEVRLDARTLAGEAALKLGLAPGRYGCLSVRDSGSGMSDETRQRLFEPFFTTKPAGMGTGLGLSVVHGIVRSHDGAVAVQSNPGQGTCFEVYLPQLGSEATSDVLSPGRGGGASGAHERRGTVRRVVFIDDDSLMGVMVERLLGRAGYEVTAFQDAAAATAHQTAEPEAVDLVVSDYNMPIHSGLDVARHVLALRPGLPCILLTGDVTAELRTRAAALGVRAVLEKQNVLDTLSAAVQQALAEPVPAEAVA
jgi:PAS domain S-box-containing protein